jgi:hypothetical protein
MWINAAVSPREALSRRLLHEACFWLSLSLMRGSSVHAAIKNLTKIKDAPAMAVSSLIKGLRTGTFALLLKSLTSMKIHWM